MTSSKILFTLFMFVILGELCGYRLFNENEKVTILARDGEIVRLICHDDIPLRECGFIWPNATITLFSNLAPGTADCVMEIEASQEADGIWTCLTSPQFSFHAETNKSIHFRTVNKLAAIEPTVVVSRGESVSLLCVTSERMTPVDLCFFTSPIGETLRMNDSLLNSNNSRYLFPVNKSMDRGDCAITLNNIQSEDAGVWYCNAWLEHDFKRYQDSIVLYVDGIRHIQAIDDDKGVIKTSFQLLIIALIISTVFILLLYLLRILWVKFSKCHDIVYTDHEGMIFIGNRDTDILDCRGNDILRK